MHYTRGDITRLFAESGQFTVHLAHDDTAWDPETGDTLLGPAVIEYDRGEFPGPEHTASIYPSGAHHQNRRHSYVADETGERGWCMCGRMQENSLHRTEA